MPKRGGTQRPKPTREDAAIMLELGQVAAMRGLDAAMNWVRSDAFVTDHGEFVKKHPPGSAGFGYVRVVATHYETVGTLWKNKLINEDFLFDWLWVVGIWDRMKGFVIGERKAAGQPRLGENFQKMATAQVRWLKTH